jgi:methylthioribose-1-phosphate isomerase
MVNILTHCNAGWLACIDWGTATAPVYKAFHKGIPLHIWVDETRPRNQGARLTAWELSQEGIPHTVIADNTGGHLMQHSLVDLCIVGSDRTTSTGDVANKIGTYLKALAAADNHVPFYVALPSSSIDFTMTDGIQEIPIEERGGEEVRWMEGVNKKGEITKVKIFPDESPVSNYGFDVTPARLITGLITERGICKADRESILGLFPEKSEKWQ